MSYRFKHQRFSDVHQVTGPPESAFIQLAFRTEALTLAGVRDTIQIWWGYELWLMIVRLVSVFQIGYTKRYEYSSAI